VKTNVFTIPGALAEIGAAVGAPHHAFPVHVFIFAGLSRKYLLSWSAPIGATTAELNAANNGGRSTASAPPTDAPSPTASEGNWPSNNRTLASEHLSQLNQTIKELPRRREALGAAAWRYDRRRRHHVYRKLRLPVARISLAHEDRNAKVVVLGLDSASANQWGDSSWDSIRFSYRVSLSRARR
jgi:hypothetical protein